jgi:hypothetical protein
MPNRYHLVRIGSWKARYLVLEYSDGTKIYCDKRGVNRQWRQGQGQDLAKHALAYETRELAAVKDAIEQSPTGRINYEGLPLRACTAQEKQFLLERRQERWLEQHHNRGREVGLIGYKKAEWQETKGGRFLMVSLRRNKSGKFNFSGWDKAKGRSIPQEWDITTPGNQVMLLVGVSRDYGAQVFELDGQLYVRAHRHHVQGRPLSTYTKYYRKHSAPWGLNRGRMALRPFTGQYLPYKKIEL